MWRLFPRRPRLFWLVVLSGGNDYEHVRYYENGKAGCLAHVREKAIHIFKQSAPVRWGELTYKGKGNESEFLKCNYIAFQNKPYTEEWYFGFVTRVEWLSDGSFRFISNPIVSRTVFTMWYYSRAMWNENILTKNLIMPELI